MDRRGRGDGSTEKWGSSGGGRSPGPTAASYRITVRTLTWDLPSLVLTLCTFAGPSSFLTACGIGIIQYPNVFRRREDARAMAKHEVENQAGVAIVPQKRALAPKLGAGVPSSFS